MAFSSDSTFFRREPTPFWRGIPRRKKATGPGLFFGVAFFLAWMLTFFRRGLFSGVPRLLPEMVRFHFDKSVVRQNQQLGKVPSYSVQDKGRFRKGHGLRLSDSAKTLLPQPLLPEVIRRKAGLCANPYRQMTVHAH